VLAGPKRLDDGIRRSHAGGKTDPVSSILECRQVCLEGRARGIGDSRVLVALVDGRRLLSVGGGLIDRRHDGACRGVRPLPGMDGPCPKPLLRLDLHIPSLVYDKARTHAWRARAANRRWKSEIGRASCSDRAKITLHNVRFE